MEWETIDYLLLAISLVLGYKLTRCITEWGDYDGC